MTRRVPMSRSRHRLKDLCALAELKAQQAERPATLQAARVREIEAEIAALAERRAGLLLAADRDATADAAEGWSAGERGRALAGADALREDLAAAYRSLALAQAELSQRRNAASRARARSDNLGQLALKEEADGRSTRA